MASINPFLPIQEGTGDPSPENVRPIKPAVSIAGGKNLLEISQDKKVIHATSGMDTFTEIEGGIQTSSEYNNLGGYLVQVKPNTTYIYSANFSISNNDIAMRIWEYKTKISVMTNARQGLIVNIFNPGISKSAVFTTSSTTNYIIVGFYTGDSRARGLTITNMMIEEGSVATSYEPYQSLDVYGGYLDIANSRIVEEWNKTKVADKRWENYSAKTYYYTNISLNRKPNTYIYSDTLTPRSDGRFLNAPVGCVTYYGESTTVASYYNYVWTTLPEAMELADANAWIAETYPDAEICYKLATSITHNLSPTQLAQAMEQLGIKLSSTLIDARRKIILNSPHLEVASGSIANFSTDMKAPLKECKIYFSPVQEGSGDPSPDNIRPITGWTGVNVWHSGENLFPYIEPEMTNTYSGVTIYNNGYNIKISGKASSSLYRAVTSSWVADGERVYIYGVLDLTGTGAYWYVFDGSNLLYGENINGSSFITRNGKNTMLAIGVDSAGEMSSAIDIDLTPVLCKQPSTQIPVSFGDNGTIYGGYVDLLKGELVEEWKEVDLGSLNWSKFSNYNVYSANITDMVSAMRTQTVIAENYKFYSATKSVINMPDKSIKNHDSNNSVYVMDTDYTTSSDVSAFKTAMAGMKMVYKLAIPITYQLTPQQLKSLKGVNNIWSDANGDVEVKFWQH